MYTPRAIVSTKHFFSLLFFMLIVCSAPPRVHSATPEMLEIRKMLQERKIPHTSAELQSVTGGFGENTLVAIPAHAALQETGMRVVFAVPAARNNTGVQAAIDLIVELQADPPPLPVDIMFLDDEKSGIPPRYGMPRHFGLRALIDEYAVPEELSLLYLDPGDDVERMLLQHGSRGKIAPLNILNPLMKALGKDAGPWAMETPWNELFRLSLVDGPEYLQYLNEAGYNALALSAGAPLAMPSMNRSSTQISARALSEALHRYIKTHPRQLDEPDTRYTLLHIGHYIWPITEQMVIIAFLLVTILSTLYILVYSMTRRSILVARMHVFLRRIWILAVLAVVLFICLFAAEFIVEAAYRRVVGASQSPGSMHMAAKGLLTIITAIAFYMLLNFVLLYRRLPVRSHFWSVATIVFFAFATLVTASIDFTFVPVFLWAYVLSFISAQFTRMLPSLVLAIAAMLPVANTLVGAAMTKGSRLLEIFTTGSPLASLYMVIVLLPFMLLIKKSLPVRSRRLGFALVAVRLPLRVTFCAVTLAASTFAFSTLPASPRESSASIQRIQSRDSTIASQADSTSIRVTRREFLDRQGLTISIPGSKDIDRIDIEIIGDTPLVMYDSQLPWTADSSGRHISFITGERPPDPLNFEVTLQRRATGIIRVRWLSYDQSDGIMRESLELVRLESR